MTFTVCYFLATGRIRYFSRAAAYYLSQRYDRITTDSGSTLSGGQWVATEHGLCLEEDWPYPPRYNPTEPASAKGKYLFKLVASQPTQDIGLIREAADMGLPIQDGIPWGPSVSKSLVTNFTDQYGQRGVGGHSTLLWTKHGANYRRINSWGLNWDGDGCNENTPEALKQQVEARHATHVIYAPEGMIYPSTKPVEV